MKLIFTETKTNNHTELVTGLSISNTQNLIATVSDDKSIVLSDTKNKKITLFSKNNLPS